MSSGMRRPHYGWIIVAASFFVTTITSASGYTFGVFLPPWRETFGWSAAAVSGAYSVCIFFYTGLGVVAGWGVDKYGPKGTTITGGLFLVTGLLLTSQVNALWQLYVTYGLIGMGMSSTYSPLMTTASRWFTKRKGLALGAIGSGISAGPLIMAPVATYIILNYGWRFCFQVMGCTAGLIIVAALMLKRGPEARSMFRTGEGDIRSVSDPQPKIGNPTSESTEFSLREAAGTKAYWMLGGAFLMVGTGLQMILVHIVSYSQIQGASPLIAATVLSFITGSSIAGRIIMGIVSDRIGRKTTLIICVFLEGTMIMCLIWASSSWMLFVFAAFFGFGYGGHGTQFPALTGEIFGLTHMGAILGAVVFFWGMGSALGSTMAGYIFDMTGSYRGAFMTGAAAMLMAGTTTIFLSKPVKQRSLNRERTR
jgi:OFA family oxalate/formate antiporter-like MFS transporter